MKIETSPNFYVDCAVRAITVDKVSADSAARAFRVTVEAISERMASPFMGTDYGPGSVRAMPPEDRLFIARQAAIYGQANASRSFTIPLQTIVQFGQQIENGSHGDIARKLLQDAAGMITALTRFGSERPEAPKAAAKPAGNGQAGPFKTPEAKRLYKLEWARKNRARKRAERNGKALN